MSEVFWRKTWKQNFNTV